MEPGSRRVLAATLAALAVFLAAYASLEARRAKGRPVVIRVAPPLAAEAQAASLPQVSISSSELPSGGLMAVRDGVKLAPFTLERTEVRAEVSGPFVSVEVSQSYANPSRERLEAVYVFPLPENAAVTDMFMRISSRVITSEVHEREQAKRIYEAAKSSGQAAALLEQERPNVFTQSVANIPPGERVFVHIRYVHELSYDAGRYRFVFPMTVGPRYVPADRVPDASRVTPPPLLPGERSGHDIDLRVSLMPGLPLESLRSPSHEVRIKRPAEDRAVVRLSPADSIPNKDFVLEWGLKAGQPEISVLSHRSKEDGFIMLTLQPQARAAARDVTPKEMVFVVDTSGSMSGEPLAKVKQAMRRAITGMNPRDSFQIIRFDDRASTFSPGPVPNTRENTRAALSYLNGLDGSGGTNMLEGIKAALDYPRDPERRRVVFFMTDGFIGNETEILAAIRQRLGETRLFSFGVGSSVNRYLLDAMAREGRGFVQYVRPDEDTARAVELFYRRIRNPLLMDLAVDWGGLAVSEAAPDPLPDLFDAQALCVFARYSRPGRGVVRVTGRVAGRPYERRIPVALAAESPAHKLLPALWARRQVDRLASLQLSGEKPELAERIKALGLKYKLMTPYTSFVAVERVIRAGIDIPLQTVLVPSEMPEGTSFEGVFGPGAAVVSIPRMKPGDPVLSVQAPPGTAAVIADFPFGKRQLCSYDSRRERWACRFLAPRGLADGRYVIKVTCVGRDGRRLPMTAEYVVDSKAPRLEITARREGLGWRLYARPKAHVLETRQGPRGAVAVVHDVKRLRLRAADGRLVAFRLERRPGEFVWSARVRMGGRVAVEAVDFAGNTHVSEVVLR